MRKRIKENRRENRKYSVKDIKKRAISLALAFALLFTAEPVSVRLWKASNEGRVVKSATKYDVGDYPVDEVVDGRNLIKITSKRNLIWYSQAYYEFDGHQNDLIEINFGEGTTTGEFEGFESIGTKEKPFRGDIVFGQTSTSIFNLDCPFFGYVYEDVSITEKNTGNSKNITLTRTDNNIMAPVFAKKVLSDGDSDTKSDWDITLEPFNKNSFNYIYSIGGIIDEIDASANVKIKIENNSVDGDRKTQISGTGDTGLVCGKMGPKSTLEADYTGSNKDFKITTKSGNVGGFVGSMADGSKLTVNIAKNKHPQGDGVEITSEKDGYAGGIVGYNDGGTVKINEEKDDGADPAFVIGQTITGQNVGGVFGYYRPFHEEDENDGVFKSVFDVDKYDIQASLVLNKAGGSVGGLFGVLENKQKRIENDEETELTGGEIIIKSKDNAHDEITCNYSGEKADNLGGLIGKYSAKDLKNTLRINSLSAVVNKDDGVKNYGGCIGYIQGTSYVNAKNFKLNKATNLAEGVETFGGVVGATNYGYLYVDGVNIGTADNGIGTFGGGGIVGNLNHGVLGMGGNINLKYSTPNDNSGCIVGSRDNALVYADEDFVYTKKSGLEVDNIGSYGDVMVFGDKLIKDVVFTENEHAITIGEVDKENIETVEDYAKASILFQIEIGGDGKNKVLSGTNIAENANIKFKSGATINLEGTGLRGITRDNGSKLVEYKGVVSATASAKCKIVFDTKNVGGNPVYRHKLTGLFGIINNSGDKKVASGLSLGGSILVKAKTDKMYVGALAAEATGYLEISDVDTTSDLAITVDGGSAIMVGRYVGSCTVNINNIKISDCIADGEISGANSNASTCFGGVIGKIEHKADATVSWDFKDITLKGTIKSTVDKDKDKAESRLSGLVSDIAGYDNPSSKNKRKLTLDNVSLNGIKIQGKTNTNMGGLLGYQWELTDVDVKNVSATGTPTVELTSGTGAVTGLVYKATGCWDIESLDLRGIKIDAKNASSVGVIVNTGKSGNNGIYLKLTADSDYKLSFADGTDVSKSVDNKQFDELVAYTAASSSDIMNNGNAIVSVYTAGLRMEDTAEDSLSYVARTEQGKTRNKNARYYYNLDTVTSDTASDLDTPQKKLMSWGVYTYASKNLKYYFADPFENNITNLNYDMKGYSWYPINYSSDVTIAGTFKFYNEEFEKCEDESSNAWSSLEESQHYMMHNGVFYNVSRNVNIGELTLQGNIGATGTNGTGALVYGTVSGSSSASSGITNISSLSGSINLDGIRVHNFASKSSSYAPLLINKVNNFVTLKISNVSTSNKYKDGNNTIEAATSLIGNAGDSTNNQYINVTFAGIKLDARSSENDPSGIAESVYNTTKSIFTRSTLLEQLQYTAGSSGTYTYTYDDDWGTGNHNVTYGLELWDGSSDGSDKPDNHTSGRDQYIGEEHWYIKTASDTELKYTSPTSASQSEPYDFSKFLPYVKQSSTKQQIKDETGNKHQLQVNHQAAERIYGCGTYNDPYIITNANDLVTISKWLQSASNFNGDVIDALPSDTWCDDKSGHTTYVHAPGTGNFYKSGDDSVSITEENMRKYLSRAYYEIPAGTSEIVLEANSGFLGFGSNAADSSYSFRGVIEGNETTITNKTANPLVVRSRGSVVRDLTINVDADITLKDATGTYDYNTSAGDNGAYGAVISHVLGGDNIIDNVQVNYGDSVIKTRGACAQFEPVGGYVGVVLQGGVIFKNMLSGLSGLESKNVTAVKGGSNPNITSYNQSVHTQNMAEGDNNLWLYVNPFVGRVIHGFAVNETTKYNPREEDATLKNGKKHYPIVDIKKYSSLTEDDKLSVSSGFAISIPDSQSMFLLSLIVNAGMGILTNTTNTTSIGTKTGYFNSDQTTRRSEYKKIGDDGLEETYGDYVDSTKDTSSTSTVANYVPYLVANYTNAVNGNYYAKQISKKDCTVELESGANYDLPDGFKGIGSFITSDHVLKVTKFDGKGAKVAQNTSYTYYVKGRDKDPKSYDFENYEHSDDVGLGLINIQSGTTNSSSKGFYDFILTGSVKANCIDSKTGDEIYYAATNDTASDPADGANVDMKKMISVGGLIGVSKNNQYIDSVALQDINIKGIRYSGGLIGFVYPPKNTTYDTTIENTKKNPSYGINVHGAANAGGMIGRSFDGTIKIDNGNATYSIKQVVSECKERTTGKDYHYGVGGFIGNCRGNSEGTTIKNVIVGTENQDELTFVKSEHAPLNTGGLIGIINKGSFNIDNCKIYNQSVSSSYTVGGLIGYIASTTSTKKESKISNVRVFCRENLDGIIESTDEASGGFVGAAKRDVKDITISESEVNGYTISGKKYAGGIVGLWGHEQDADGKNKLITKNVNVSKNTITATSTTSNQGYAGGLIGYMTYTGSSNSKQLYGYNVLERNITLNGNGNNVGSICGGVKDATNNVIKLAGFSRIDTRENSAMVQNTIGGGGTYGTGGYVVFADYRGDALDEDTRSQTFSNVNSTNNVLATAGGAVTDNNPYVTSTLPYGDKLDETNKYFLTSDGMSEVQKAGSGNTTKVLSRINSDINSEKPGYYLYAKDNIDDYESAYSTITRKLSTFSEEAGSSVVADKDFPVLIVDDLYPPNVTELINNYLRLLTNTDMDFQTNNSNVFEVKLSKCTYSADGSTLTIDGNSSCLKNKGDGFFSMNSSDTDTASETPQFSLIDVQFKDPSTPSKVAYHLYVPVYVKKLLEYDFRINLASGTNYVDTIPVTDIRENTILENLGTPLTAEFAYSYNRTGSDWAVAAQSGDSLLDNYSKKLNFSNSSLVLGGEKAGIESGNSVYDCKTKMVLIDVNDSGKSYYLDKLDETSFKKKGTSDIWELDLQKFKDINGNAFEPKKFNDMMTVTASKSTSGTFVKVSDYGGTATVKDNSGGANDGVKFRMIDTTAHPTDSSIPASDKYEIDIDASDNLTERYFLTIFTTANYESGSKAVYHYDITCPETMGSTPYPSRVSDIHQDSHFVTGYIYDNTLTVTPDTELNMSTLAHAAGDDYVLRTNLSATIGITEESENIVNTYLTQISSISIFQSLMLSLDKHQGGNKTRGIEAIKKAVPTSYTINGKAATNADEAGIVTPNYIEFRNNEQLRIKLAQGVVTISADVELTFTEDDLKKQFLPGPEDGVGTSIVGYSNIASDNTKTAYSEVSKKSEDNHYYYYDGAETAELNYNAYADSEIGDYGQLGINAKELDENPVPITSLGSYNITHFQSSAAKANFIKCEIEMLSNDDGYSEKKVLGEFLQSLNVSGKTSPVSSLTLSNSKKWTYVFNKSAFDLKSGVYEIPIDFKVYTGQTDEFEGSSRKYANYEVKLTVSMLETQDGNPIDGSEQSDYIKYTNSRIYTGRVNPNK